MKPSSRKRCRTSFSSADLNAMHVGAPQRRRPTFERCLAPEINRAVDTRTMVGAAKSPAAARPLPYAPGLRRRRKRRHRPPSSDRLRRHLQRLRRRLGTIAEGRNRRPGSLQDEPRPSHAGSICPSRPSRRRVADRVGARTPRPDVGCPVHERTESARPLQPPRRAGVRRLRCDEREANRSICYACLRCRFNQAS